MTGMAHLQTRSLQQSQEFLLRVKSLVHTMHRDVIDRGTIDDRPLQLETGQKVATGLQNLQAVVEQACGPGRRPTHVTGHEW